MRRKILFKAKRKDNGEWVEGFFFMFNRKAYITSIEQTFMTTYYTEESVVDFNMRAFEIDPETLCQYTGPMDKNGQKIWENDLCKINSGRICIDEENGYFIVKWDDSSARYVLSGDGLTVDFDSVFECECEVVGNIFDNQELAKGAIL